MLGGEETVALPWIVVAGFLRITTNRRAFPTPLSAASASGIVGEWLTLDVVAIPLEKPDHRSVLKRLVLATGTAANLVTDAHIAAISLTRGATLVSCDRDFERFEGLRVENPLARAKG